MAFASTSILMVERFPRNGCHQHLFPQGEFQVPPLSPEALQDHQVGLTQSPFKLLPLHWDLECVRFCLHLWRVESLFPTALYLSYMSVPLAFKARHSWGSPPDAPHWGAWCGPWTLALWGEPLPSDYPPTCGSPPGVVGLDCTTSSPLLSVSLWFLLSIFRCGKSLLIFRSFS